MAMIVKPMNPAIYAEWNSFASLSLRLLIEFPPIAIGNHVSPTVPMRTAVATFLQNESSVFLAGSPSFAGTVNAHKFLPALVRLDVASVRPVL